MQPKHGIQQTTKDKAVFKLAGKLSIHFRGEDESASIATKIFGLLANISHYCTGQTILTQINAQTLGLHWTYREVKSAVQIAATLGCIDAPISFTNQTFRATAGFNARLLAVLAAFRIQASSGTSCCAGIVHQITGTLNFCTRQKVFQKNQIGLLDSNHCRS